MSRGKTEFDSDQRWLRGPRPRRPTGQSVVRVVDLFCGSGGMTLGIEESARRVGRRIDVRLAVDSSVTSCLVYKSNFEAANVVAADISDLLDGHPGEPVTDRERALAKMVGDVTLLIGGPPCEGHSDLNNHTRREDAKNVLYFRMARAADVLKPDIVAIENVPPVQWDRGQVVELTREALSRVGYSVAAKVIDMSKVGVPQRRRRYILLASRLDHLNPNEVLDGLEVATTKPRTVRWAIGDVKENSMDGQLDRPARASAENRDRIDYLFDHKVYDLPNTERPECHRDNEHSYVSMYGRLRWTNPAQTITTGFSSMGQGRYVHPAKRRTLTPHEAARLQTFPDWFDWSKAQRRTALSTMIGNAVPPLMMAALGERLLRKISAEATD